MNEVLYCYRCGKHVMREAGKCLYCSAPKRRSVRPPRHCPFCDEEIGFKAVKCPHCGEFLDGRVASPSAAGQQQGPQQVFFLIDKAIIQGDQPLMLQAGGAVPPEVAQRLSHQTLQAIQMGNPALLDQQGVKALPAPTQQPASRDFVVESGAILDVTPEPSAVEDAQPTKARKSSAESQYLPVPSSHAVVPVAPPEAGSGTQIAKAFARGAGYALAKAGDFALDLWTARKSRSEQQPPAAESEEDRYAQCTNCNTEVLKADNYCYHCGQLLRSESVHPAPRLRDKGRPTFGLLAFTLLLMGMMAFGKDYLKQFQNYPGMGFVMPALAVISLLLLFSAFFRKRTSLNQIIVILMAVLWLIALAMAFLG